MQDDIYKSVQGSTKKGNVKASRYCGKLMTNIQVHLENKHIQEKEIEI